MPNHAVSASQRSNLPPILRRQLVEMVEKFYDLGRVLELHEIFGGYINRSFRLVVQRDGVPNDYLLRKYNPAIAEQEVKFEHALINHCVARGLTVVARVILNRQGATFIRPAGTRRFFAVYEYLEGEDKYSWDKPELNDEEFVSASKILANFHSAAVGFNPGNLRRVEPPIYDLLPTFNPGFKELAETGRDSKFRRFFLVHLENILESVENARISGSDVSWMPFCPIHCDFHPGNLKYENNRVSGIFDFDWSKIDLRLFDVCMAIDYFCCSWDKQNDGRLSLEKAALFLNTYQEELCRTGGIQPLLEVEINNIPDMLAAANLYIINWIVSTFFADDDLDEDEYLAYLKHNVELMYSIEACKNEIFQIISAIYRTADGVKWSTN